MSKGPAISVAIFLVAALSTLRCVFAEPTPRPRVWPTSFEIELDAKTHNAHVESIRNDKNMPIFELRLDPVFDSANSVIGWDVGVFDLSPDAKSHRHNLLSPRGNWHGLQPFMIIASSKDAFGRRWTVAGDGLSCVIEVMEEKISPSDVLPGAFVFESAKIGLQLRPATPGK